MFVGFIAVVVILLIIVGLMSTGATSGSGGVDQTKATKAISEISALAQSTGFYKTTVDTTNYAGLTVQKLIDNGIVSVNDTVTATAADYDLDAKTTIADGDKVVASKAVPGLVYKLESDLAGAATTGTASDSYFDIEIAAGTGLSDGLKKALDSTYAKINC